MADFNAAAKAERAERKAVRDEPILVYASKLKLGLLAAAPLLIAVAAIGETLGLVAGQHSRDVTIAASIIGILAAGVLLSMAFDPKPVLRIDRDGITCRRPAIGLIPWAAISGMGLGRAVLVRSVLLIALDDLDDDLKGRLERHTSGSYSFFSRQVAHFKGQMKNRPTIQIPISFLSMSPDELRRRIEERVQYRGGD